jgi:protein-disulfide isomerase
MLKPTCVAATIVTIGLATSGHLAPASAQDRSPLGYPDMPVPPALKQFDGKGIKLIMVGKANGFDVWMAMLDGNPASTRFFYLSADGQSFLDGPMFDGRGNNLTREHRRAVANAGRLTEQPDQGPLPQAAAQPVPTVTQQIQTIPANKILSEFNEATHWLAIGDPGAPSEILMFSDPTCPHCSKTWQALQPYIDKGRLYVRLIPVGILSQRSAELAATIMNAEDATAAWLENERLQGIGQTLPSIGPAKVLPQAALAIIHNNGFFRNAKIEGTPYLAWRDKGGERPSFITAPCPTAGMCATLS